MPKHASVTEASDVVEHPPMEVQNWNIDRLVFYARNPRKNDAVVDRMCASIREFGFKIPVLARSDGEVVDGHLRLKAAKKLRISEVPVILCDEWSPAQVKAFRLMVNRSVSWAQWDDELLALELQELNEADFDLSLTGFDPKELDDLLADPEDDEKANATPPLPETATSRLGDLWICGRHRVLCGDCTNADVVACLLGDRKPSLMVTDPPYGIQLDSEWRDRAGLNGCGPAEASYMKKRTKGHNETTISGDTRADWSEAFELVPSLQIAYVWHASVFTREVLNGLLRIGFLYPQQIIWNKGRTVLTRTHYWYQHEPCGYVRKKNAPWFGKAGENSTVWDSASPKFIMGGSDEEKFDHPRVAPVPLRLLEALVIYGSIFAGASLLDGPLDASQAARLTLVALAGLVWHDVYHVRPRPPESSLITQLRKDFPWLRRVRRFLAGEVLFAMYYPYSWLYLAGRLRNSFRAFLNLPRDLNVLGLFIAAILIAVLRQWTANRGQGYNRFPAEGLSERRITVRILLVDHADKMPSRKLTLWGDSTIPTNLGL